MARRMLWRRVAWRLGGRSEDIVLFWSLISGGLFGDETGIGDGAW